MFTGLIEETGEIAQLAQKRGARRLTVAARRISRQLKIGQSVAVSGVCLTAVEVARGKSFAADLARETLARTSFSTLRRGAVVNLELPRAAGGTLDGHIVQGHVDGVAKLVSLRQANGKSRSAGSSEDWELQIAIPHELTKYVVEKGSITVEGISLTVARVSSNQVSIAIIPHTYAATNLNTLKPGAPLNIEVDVLAKYAEKRQASGENSRITLARLVEEGF